MRGNPRLEYAGQSVDQMIADYMQEHAVPGMALAIVCAPYVTRACGYGVADPERGLLTATRTLFPLGDMRCAYTAVALMQLVEAGALTLDDVQSALRARDHAAQVALVERIQPYEAFVRSEQFARLGLRETFFASELSGTPHERFPSGGHHEAFLHRAELINPLEPARLEVGPGELYASASDVSTWDIGLAGDILIKNAELRKLLYQPGPDSPWTFPGRPGLMVITGTNSLLSRFTDPADLLCVTLLANRPGLDLTQLARRIAGAHDIRLGPPLATASMRVQQSPFTVDETLERLEQVLTLNGVSVLGRVDHSAAAAQVSLDLPPTRELIFGNPAAGTLLMQAQRAVAVDLPLRAAAWEENGEVWLAASDPVAIARAHGLEGQPVVAKMRAALDRALLAAVTGT